LVKKVSESLNAVFFQGQINIMLTRCCVLIGRGGLFGLLIKAKFDQLRTSFRPSNQLA